MDIVNKLKKHIEVLSFEDETTPLDKGVVFQAFDEIVLLRQHMADLLYAWHWWQDDPYDREGPWDEIYEIKKYMESCGYKIDKFGVTKLNQ